MSKTNASVKKAQRSRFGTVPGELIKIIIDQIKKGINDSKLIYMFNLSQIVNSNKLSHYFMIDQLKSIISGCDHDIYIFVFIGKSQHLQKNIKKAFNNAKSEYNWQTLLDISGTPDYDKYVGQCWSFANEKSMLAKQKIEQGCVIGIYADNIKELQNINTQSTNNKKNNQKQQQIVLHESLFQNFNKIYLKYCITQSFNYDVWQGTLLHELQHYFDPMKDYLHSTRGKKVNPDIFFGKNENGQHFNKKFITNRVNFLNKWLKLKIDLNTILKYTATKEEIGPQMVEYLNFVIANYCNNNKDEWNKLKEFAKNQYSNINKKFFDKVKQHDINKATVLYLMLNFRGKVTETIQKQAEDILNNPKGSETYYLANNHNHNQLNNMA